MNINAILVLLYWYDLLNQKNKNDCFAINRLHEWNNLSKTNEAKFFYQMEDVWNIYVCLYMFRKYVK